MPTRQNHAAYLLTWNPRKWHWDDLHADVREFRRKGRLQYSWSCGNNKSIRKGSRLFLMRLGVPPKEIVASGWATSTPYYDTHWHWRKEARGEKALYIDAELDWLAAEPVLALEDLIVSYPDFHWTPQISGVRIPPEIAAFIDRELKTRVRAGLSPETQK